MRLAFWRAGKDEAVVQRAVATPAPAVSAPSTASEAGDLDLRALGQALMRKRGWIIVPTLLAARALARRRQPGHAALQVRSAHPDRRPRERVPAAERRAQRGAHRARRRGRDQPGAAAAVARSGARDHQEEQARRAAGIRSGAAGRFAAEIAAGAVRHRPRSVLADAGRARAGRLLRPASPPMRSTSRASSSSNSSRAIRSSPRASPTRSPRAIWCCSRTRGRSRRKSAGPVAVGRNRQPAQEGRRSRSPGRGFPLEIEPVRRHQQHHAVEPADGRAQHPAEQRPRAEVGRRNRRRG